MLVVHRNPPTMSEVCDGTNHYQPRWYKQSNSVLLIPKIFLLFHNWSRPAIFKILFQQRSPVAMVSKFLDLNTPLSCKYGSEHEKIDKCCFKLVSCAWLHSGTKRQLNLFFHRSKMKMAVSVKKDCDSIQKFSCHGKVTSHFFLIVKHFRRSKSYISFSYQVSL